MFIISFPYTNSVRHDNLSRTYSTSSRRKLLGPLYPPIKISLPIITAEAVVMPLQPQRWRRVIASSTLEMVFCFSSLPSTHLLFSCLLHWILISFPKLALNSCRETYPMRPSLEQPAQKAVAGCTSQHTQGTSS